MLDPAMTGTFEIKLPNDLLAQAQHAKAKRKGQEMHVEGWKGSWLSRLLEKLVGED